MFCAKSAFIQQLEQLDEYCTDILNREVEINTQKLNSLFLETANKLG